jgi:hypothetical protein
VQNVCVCARAHAFTCRKLCIIFIPTLFGVYFTFMTWCLGTGEISLVLSPQQAEVWVVELKSDRNPQDNSRTLSLSTCCRQMQLHHFTEAPEAKKQMPLHILVSSSIPLRTEL